MPPMQETSDYIYSFGKTLPTISPKEQEVLEQVRNISFERALSSFTNKGHDPLSYTLVTHEKVVWRTEILIDFRGFSRPVDYLYKPTPPPTKERHSFTYLSLSMFLANPSILPLNGQLIMPPEYLNQSPVPEEIGMQYFNLLSHERPNRPKDIVLHRKTYRVGMMHSCSFSLGEEVYYLSCFAFQRSE
jgi:hypothetical protein